MRNLRQILPALTALIFVTAGCRIDMHVQPYYRPLAKSDFFADGRSARNPVDGTVARGDRYWPPVRRIDGGYGDRNLVCSCPPIEDLIQP